MKGVAVEEGEGASVEVVMLVVVVAGTSKRVIERLRASLIH
jgi:hypothetical protein